MKIKTVYICSKCGAKYPRWMGRCSNCGEFNTLIEEIQDQSVDNRTVSHQESSKPISIVEVDKSPKLEKVSSGISNLDDALGGGLVKGQVILISGEPGIGKSTLLLQVASNIAKQNKKVIYISGEESVNQIYLRGKRINALDKNLYILSETNLEKILYTLEKEKPDFFIIDSVQTTLSENLESSAGSVSQVKYTSGKLTEFAKQFEIPVFLVGQITKEGNIAGPKILEHIVDTVVYFEGEKGYAYRVLKVRKNRFGSTGEIAVFNMTSTGLKEVAEPSFFFLSEKPEGKAGSIIFPYTEGSKPVLVEIQALVSKTFYPVPQRKTQGIDINKLSIITAILEKEAKIQLGDKDIFINVVGGMNIREPAVDLPLALAILSSVYNKPISSEFCAFGEIGLTGEIRSVYYMDLRIKEAKKFGIKNLIVPKQTGFNDSSLLKVSTIKDAINILF